MFKTKPQQLKTKYQSRFAKLNWKNDLLGVNQQSIRSETQLQYVCENSWAIFFIIFLSKKLLIN